MKVRKAFAVTALAAALSGGVAAAPAIAQESSVSPAAQSVSYIPLWSGTHTPTRYWATPDFVQHHSRWLATNFGCWGHDGARIKAEIVRTRDHHVMNRSAYQWCHDGHQYRLDATVSRGTAYYMRLYLKGPKHSMYAKAYEVR
ncbi:hypothetical protein AB0M29_42355 [Streptomyces sp. NPDC051976]|uniref:hypothetical protein n=1 Tax=Streptomyces sp. NPDC051976 TaxID=3154947 RepID=UPI0034410F54